MNELNWRIFKFTIVLTSIGLFFAALCILDACIRSYWARKQQLLPKHQKRAEEIVKVCTWCPPHKFELEIEVKILALFIVNPLLIGPDFPRV